MLCISSGVYSLLPHIINCEVVEYCSTTLSPHTQGHLHTDKMNDANERAAEMILSW